LRAECRARIGQDTSVELLSTEVVGIMNILFLRYQCDTLVFTSGLNSVSTAIVKTPTAFCCSHSEIVSRYLTKVIICNIICDAAGGVNCGCSDCLFVYCIRYLVQNSLHVINTLNQSVYLSSLVNQGV